MQSRWLAASLALCLLASAGCGYHTAGHNVTLPENVKTLAIPAFVNQSQTYRIEQTLTAAVVREFTPAPTTRSCMTPPTRPTPP